MQFYASPEIERAALRRASARTACDVHALAVTRAPSEVRGVLACADGWAAGKLLLALAIEDARTDGARELARQIRAELDDESFARAIQAFVKARVRFAPEEGEIFQSGAWTLNHGFGDCDDHFRLAYALAAAGGLKTGLALLHHGADAPPEMQGPAHAVLVVEIGGAWVWLETTVDAGFGENPNDAARRLGLSDERTDIAREVKIMTESDLPPVPEGFVTRNPPAQVLLDAHALQALGYLASDVPQAALVDPTSTVLRLAVLAFQRAKGLHPDGLLGDLETRPAIATELREKGIDVDYTIHIGGLGDVTAPTEGLFTHAQARAALRAAYVAQFGHEPTSGELDFGLATAYFETFYGRGGPGGAPWQNRGQFGRWARDGKFNWGALESGTADTNERTFAKFVAVGLHPTKEKGTDGGNTTFFYLFPSDEEAARAFLMSWGAADTLAAAAANDANGVAAAMRRHGYYTGFHVGPGKLTPQLQEANRRLGRAAWVEEASDDIALQKNIADYASGLARTVKAVQGSGGVDSPPKIGAGSGALVTTVLVTLAALGGLAWWTFRA